MPLCAIASAYMQWALMFGHAPPLPPAEHPTGHCYQLRKDCWNAAEGAALAFGVVNQPWRAWCVPVPPERKR